MLDVTMDLLRQGVLTPAGPLTAWERAALSVELTPGEGVECFVRGFDDDAPALWVGTTFAVRVLSPARMGWEPAVLPWWAIRRVDLATHRWGAGLVLRASRHVYCLDGAPTIAARDFMGHLHIPHVALVG